MRESPDSPCRTGGFAGESVSARSPSRVRNRSFWAPFWSDADQKGAQKLRLRTREGLLTLTLSPAKPPVLHGESGLSRKGPGPDEYSSYVSITRLNASGTLEKNGKTEALTGHAWFDHEWGPGGLPAGISGWDWFALILEDGSELMLYRMRQTAG